MTGCYYKVRPVLQTVSDCYYKMSHGLQRANVITKGGVTPEVEGKESFKKQVFISVAINLVSGLLEKVKQTNRDKNKMRKF